MECVEGDAVLVQLENIYETDELGINFVKNNNLHYQLFTTYIHLLHSFFISKRGGVVE
jgi:hypothetical protein